MKKSLLLLVGLVVFITIFSVQNAEKVAIRFVFWNGKVSLAVLMILTFIIGALVGAIYILYFKRKKAKKKDYVGDATFDSNEDKTDEKEII